MKAVSGCPGWLLIVSSALLGAYTLIIIPVSNFTSGSNGTQNAMILPNLVIGVVMFISGCVMVAVGGNGDGGASSDYSSPTSSTSEVGQSALGSYWTRLGNEADAWSNQQRGIPTSQWSDGAKTTPEYEKQRIKDFLDMMR